MANKNITFTLEYHQSCLKNSCRICGNRAQTFAEIAEGKKPHFCDQHKDKIYFFYGIDVIYDSNLHPKVMCSACMNRLKNAKVLSVDTKIDKECYLGENEKVQIVSELWKPHSRINCKLCMKHDRENKGGRPKKASKRRGRPKMQQKTDIISSNLFSHFFYQEGNDDSENYENVEIHNVSEGQKQTYICTICQHIFLFASVKTRCDHYFSACCLDQYFRHKSSTTVTCPVCPKAISINDIKAADERFQQQLLTLDVKCSKSSYTGLLSNFTMHNCNITTVTPLKSGTDDNPLSSTPLDQRLSCNRTTESERNTFIEIDIQTSPTLLDNSGLQGNTSSTLDETLQRSLKSPLSIDEERVHTHLTKRKLNFSKDTDIITCKTRGQPLLLHRVVKPRKSSSTAQLPLKRKRANIIARFRSNVAGKDVESCHIQASELKILSHKSKLNIYVITLV